MLKCIYLMNILEVLILIGIIGAMSIEIENIKNNLTNLSVEKIKHINYFQGKLNNVDCVVALCGPGKVNSAICTQIMILKYNVKAILNIGLAGGISSSLKIGDIVIAKDVVQHDVDTSAVGDEKGFISGLNLINIPCSKYLNDKISKTAKDLGLEPYYGTVASGDQFIKSKSKLLKIQNDFNACACELEAGSVGQVCSINDVQFSVLKTISDMADENSDIDYEKFKNIVVKKNTELLLKLMQNI